MRLDKLLMNAVSTPDLSVARTMMVDSQVRPNKVVDPRIIAAMRMIPREAFLPPSLAARAYADENVPLGGGRVMPAPMIVARMIQISQLADGARVLVVGAGTGYGAALLAACGVKVTALEDDPALLAIARLSLQVQAPSVTLVEAPIAEGVSSGAPYDCIFVEGAADHLPDVVVAQLAPDGILVMVRCGEGLRMGQAVIGRKTSAAQSFKAVSLIPVFDCLLPALPALRRTAGFVF